jgi:hypothetical protein
MSSGEDGSATRRPKLGAVATGAIVAMVAACCGGISSLVYGFLALFGEQHYDQLLTLAAIVALAAGSQVAALAWAWSTRPGAVRIAVTQAPYAALWLAVAPWWYVARWPLSYALWGLLVALGVAAATAWYLAAPRQPRRAVAYLAALALLLGSTAAGTLAIRWRASDGFGLLGQPEPWMAWRMATAASCLSSQRFHTDRTGTVEADCPSGPDVDHHAGTYDTARWARAAEPEAWPPFARWHEASKLRYSFNLQFSADNWLPATAVGDVVSADITVTVDHWGPWRVPDTWRLSRLTETWHVEIERGQLGGWKVARITVADPIELRPIAD